MIKELENEFMGTGEAKGFKFRKIESRAHTYLYEVSYLDTMYYEVFKRRKSPVCVDFNKRLYSDTDFKEIYPKSNRFGIDAWTFSDLEKAKDKMKEIEDSILHNQN